VFAKPSSLAARDRAGDQRMLLGTAGAILFVFCAAAAVQTVILADPTRAGFPVVADAQPEVRLRLLVNVVCCVCALLAAGLARLVSRPVGIRALATIGIAVVATAVRVALLHLLGLSSPSPWAVVLGDAGVVFVVVMLALGLGLLQVTARQRLRQQERARAAQELRASEALAALASEELRVRREVAEGLHDTVQNRLALTEAGIRAMAARWARGEGGPGDAAELARIGAELDAVRGRDVRDLSRLLYPVGVGVGVAHAIRLLARRLPDSIATEVHVDDALVSPDGSDPLDPALRVAIVRTAEEGVTNALRHGRAGRIRFTLVRRADPVSAVVLEVEDDGEGLDGDAKPDALARSAERARAFGGTLALDRSELGGARLRLVLPYPPAAPQD
jgi:signal transduction histidine kinase